MTFNPKAYAQRSDQVAENYEKREKWREENKHLALPFFIEGLREYVPDIYPGEMAVIGAPSGDGKTKMLKTWHRQAQEKITASGMRAVTVFGSQEETTERLLADDIETRGKAIASSTPSVFIGTSFGMDAESIEDIHMTNFITTLNYVNKDMFAEPMPLAMGAYDYLQATPNDPLRKMIVSNDSYRHQVNDNTRRLFKAAQTFKMPLVTGAQTDIKTEKNKYDKEIPVPGRGDFSEASAIYQIPDFVYTFVHMRNASTVGKHIETGNWKFTVEKNLLFMWFLKARGHNPETTAKGVGRVFPIRIINDEYTYDADYHKAITGGRQ
jgi:replicative DNA helicase